MNDSDYTKALKVMETTSKSSNLPAQFAITMFTYIKYIENNHNLWFRVRDANVLT